MILILQAIIALVWDAVPEANGYRIYLSNNSFVQEIAVLESRKNLEIPPGISRIWVTAINAYGESTPSNDLTIEAPEGRPTNPIPAPGRFSLSIEKSLDLKNWESIHQQEVLAPEANCFYRLVLSP